MWTMIIAYFKNPVNIVATLLAIALAATLVFATGQYVALGVKNVKIDKQGQTIKEKDSSLMALTSRNVELAQTVKQVQIQVQRERTLRKKAEAIKMQIREGMKDEEVVSVRNDIVDLFNDGMLAEGNSPAKPGDAVPVAGQAKTGEGQ